MTFGPLISTDRASDITDRSATLTGSIHSAIICVGGVEVWFEWGETISYGNKTSSQIVFSDLRQFSAVITGLRPTTIYNYRAVAKDRDGKIYYGDNRAIYTPLKESKDYIVY